MADEPNDYVSGAEALTLLNSSALLDTLVDRIRDGEVPCYLRLEGTHEANLVGENRWCQLFGLVRMKNMADLLKVTASGASFRAYFISGTTDTRAEGWISPDQNHWLMTERVWPARDKQPCAAPDHLADREFMLSLVVDSSNEPIGFEQVTFTWQDVRLRRADVHALLRGSVKLSRADQVRVQRKELVAKHQGNIASAAKALGIKRQSFVQPFGGAKKLRSWKPPESSPETS